MLRQTGRYATAVDADRVWAVYTSVDAWPCWSSDIQRASMDAPFEPGRHGRVKFHTCPRGAST